MPVMLVELPDCNAATVPVTDAPLYTMHAMLVAFVQVPMEVSPPADTLQAHAHACCVPAVDVMTFHPPGIDGMVVLDEYAKTTIRSPSVVLLNATVFAVALTACVRAIGIGSSDAQNWSGGVPVCASDVFGDLQTFAITKTD
jgi:hypothetical protein